MHLCWHHHLDILLRNMPYLHTRGVIQAVSPWVMHPLVPLHSADSSCSNCPTSVLSCTGRAVALQGDFQYCQGRFDCYCIPYNASELWFFFKFPPSHLVVYCLLFKTVDWSSFFFMCKSLSLADTLMRVLVVLYTPHFFYHHFYLNSFANHGLHELP